MRRSMSFSLVLCSLLLALPAVAQKKRGPGKPTPDRTAENCVGVEGDRLEACKVLGAYLDAWKKKNWAEVRKLIHPMTVEKIAVAKKNIGEERHAMAPWYWADKVYLLTDWKLQNAKDAYGGTVEINTMEASYRVEEDGFEEGEPASYLVGKKDGKWYVAERRAGGGGFNENSIRVGMKGYFDEAPAKKETPAPQAEEPADD